MKRLIIAGTGSGVGKTSLTLGIIRQLRDLDLKVVSFKCGPDYLDPSWHRIASGEECYNLDGWMTDKDYVTSLFDRVSQDYDIAVIEGVMGLFDGASPTSLEGSTAQVAHWLNAPVILVCNSHGTARSLAATVKGYDSLEEDISIDGIIANFCGSEGHARILTDALQNENLAPLVGWLKRDILPELPSRHLGLHSATQVSNAEQCISKISKTITETIDINKLVEVADRPWEKKGINNASEIDSSLKIGIAWDEAFQFYYPDNLEMMRAAGFEIELFSPLKDSEVPECDLLYFGGGYPEVYADELSKNSAMRESIKKHFSNSKCIYAECGGLMYLSKFVKTVDGNKFPMASILPFATEMLTKRKMLGYITTSFESDCFFGRKGVQLRGHEFHYSQIIEESSEDWQKVYSLQGRRKGSKPRNEGFFNTYVLASYVHQHFASNPKALHHLKDYLTKIYNKNTSA